MSSFKRLLQLPEKGKHSVLLLGPRGTGKTSWIKAHLPNIIYIDLLEAQPYNELLANPSALAKRIPKNCQQWIVIDEIQKIPELLNEVHRLIELHHYRFLLTGSSARKLRQKGVNLLAGRAFQYFMHPLTCTELGDQFSLKTALTFGLLPFVYSKEDDPAHYLSSYIATYLREEVQQEGILRNIGEFSRFLQIASFSQGQLVNYSEIAREAAIERRIVSSYFEMTNDLLLGRFLPVFSKRTKRRLVTQSKFYFFDVGVYRAIRPKGPLDLTEEIDGAALETLFLQHLIALNDYHQLNYEFYYWRTSNQVEVDFIAYGEKGLLAFEIKRRRSISSKDLTGLNTFSKDYPMAKLYFIFGGNHEEFHGDVHCIPIESALQQLSKILGFH
ncbi:MAG: ATPase [Gammaproteobacteria bacterium RIFCSPLOWO2_02_FULL_42_14]|nr:MAG: ATPase [Gammaproteobacteria bacterium RIFCSPHIGHO2_02_FULL_42_43]OGT29527.1 MAG: ATPase [Gammaproteobacteria bacterium RIFCSPHIGHO2_01_FULL_42_8]OGT52428.1 MAG: ATPase [Gammaproteobacteria bacterium RIFCSPHIGHO2_12_FULL_41_25]OGT62494.1 MAG: ATPase [Gammaproteobacteria bacterium RIFCSPLOWO2_02_FULL_42_14]OGT86442.1 MAG: ATPase [Gammaproteobacteria bacterium RIFCSPLOWO2_12_FULL_42_18]